MHQGVKVPEPLRRYLPEQEDFIPFAVKAAPAPETKEIPIRTKN